MSYTFSIDNTGLQLIKIPHPESSLYSIDGFVDIALTTLDTASANERSRILRDLCLFLEAETDTFWAVKFLLHWIILESNANYNYDDYLQGPGEEIIGKDERNEVRKVAVEHFRETWDEDQVEHLKYVLDQDHIYEASSKTKIKIYLEYLDIDFDTQEMMDIIELARNARNPLLHRNTDERLINNKDVVTDIRKVSFYILLDRLGVDKEFRKRIYTPKIFGPDIK
ncbi:hypothetical protein C492_11835 [Natronococcus jeotgali DSM 18795]|uniref:Uncharacterized protein n=2 Tax=Natronococcus jeotgali TaxID=413812 RepID=L9X9U8_9EURY|nr:hypothetical protein C492_11835 [Natronococcus jeotgali DSM 18795]